MKKRILLYTDDSGEGGVAYCNHSLLKHLAKLGYQMTYAQGAASNAFIEEQKKLGIDQVDLKYTAGQDFAKTLKDLTIPESIFSATKPDLIIFSDGWSYSNFAAKFIAIKMGIPFIIVLHWIEPACGNFSYGDAISYVDAVSYYFAQAKAAIVVSKENLKLVHEVHNPPKNKLQVIYNGITSRFFTPPSLSVRLRLRQQLGVPEDAVVCFTSARLAPVKGYEYQLEAIQQLKQTDIWQKLYFLWAGTGNGNRYINSETQLKEMASAMGLDERVKFLGQRSDIPDLLDASDIFVLPSKAEGMPISIMEAMAKGLPVVASAVSGTPEELGDTGRLLPDPNLDSQLTVRVLVETVQTWAKDSNLRQQSGRACKRRAETLFKEEQMLQQYETVVHKVLQQEIKPNNFPFDEKSFNQCMFYGFHVWNAWKLYTKGELAQVFGSLQESLNYTPFSRTETLLNWIECFAKFSSEQGEIFDTFQFTGLNEWKMLADSIYFHPSVAAS